MTEYPFHEVANLFPMMDDDAFADLCEDISENGLLEPIWLYDGQIIDGRNRYKACLKTGTIPKFRTWENQGGLVGFVCSLNLKRRHLDSSQKAAIALDILPRLEAEAKQKQREHGGTAPGKIKETLLELIPEVPEPHKTSVVVAAELLGTNARYIQDMKTIAKEAPERVQEIREGKINIPRVMNALRPKKPLDGSKTKEGRGRQAMQANQLVGIAIRQLELIRDDDAQRIPALKSMQEWISGKLRQEEWIATTVKDEQIVFD